MTLNRRSIAAAALVFVVGILPLGASSAKAEDGRDRLVHSGVYAVNKLEAMDPRAQRIANQAKAVLVFPSILKAGFIFGAETGNGVLLVDGRAVGFYNITGGSWGLQIGGEDFGYAVFFMNDSSLEYLKKSGGFAAGTGPSLVVVNKGAATEADTTTLTHDVYAFPFSEKGLMADITLQGTKITRIHN